MAQKDSALLDSMADSVIYSGNGRRLGSDSVLVKTQMKPLVDNDMSEVRIDDVNHRARRSFDPSRFRGWDYWEWHERALYIITWIMMTLGMILAIGFTVATFAIIVESDLTSDVDYLKEMLYLIGQSLKQLHIDCSGP